MNLGMEVILLPKAYSIALYNKIWFFDSVFLKVKMLPLSRALRCRK